MLLKERIIEENSTQHTITIYSQKFQLYKNAFLEDISQKNYIKKKGLLSLATLRIQKDILKKLRTKNDFHEDILI